MADNAIRVGLLGATAHLRAIAERLSALFPVERIDVDASSTTKHAGSALSALADRSDVIVSAIEGDRLAREVLTAQVARTSSCVIVDVSAIAPQTLVGIAAAARLSVYGAALGRRPTGETIATVLYIDPSAMTLAPVASVARALADDIVCVPGIKAKALGIVEGLLAGVNGAIVSEAVMLAETAGIHRSDIVRLIHKGSGATAMMDMQERLLAEPSAADALDHASSLRDGLSSALNAAQALEHPLLFASVAIATLRMPVHHHVRCGSES
ncbi:MAG TPA: hypothetical protein VMV45_17335, partial [Casimicrobiaceae bacterium]|nr:hypothetical protein [Casimicrobiaceae bacterium]